jgi:hypothetical protein
MQDMQDREGQEILTSTGPWHCWSFWSMCPTCLRSAQLQFPLPARYTSESICEFQWDSTLDRTDLAFEFDSGINGTFKQTPHDSTVQRCPKLPAGQSVCTLLTCDNVIPSLFRSRWWLWGWQNIGDLQHAQYITSVWSFWSQWMSQSQ